MSSTDADVLAQLEQVLDRRDEVRRIERALLERRFQAQLDVEFQAAHFAEIVFARVEEHAVEKRRRGFERRRIARTQLAVDFDQRFLGRADGVLFKRAADDDADVVAIREADIHFRDARFGDRRPTFPAVSGLLASSSTSPVWRFTSSPTVTAPSRSAAPTST